MTDLQPEKQQKECVQKIENGFLFLPSSFHSILAVKLLLIILFAIETGIASYSVVIRFRWPFMCYAIEDHIINIRFCLGTLSLFARHETFHICWYEFRIEFVNDFLFIFVFNACLVKQSLSLIVCTIISTVLPS